MPHHFCWRFSSAAGSLRSIFQQKLKFLSTFFIRKLVRKKTVVWAQISYMMGGMNFKWPEDDLTHIWECLKKKLFLQKKFWKCVFGKIGHVKYVDFTRPVQLSGALRKFTKMRRLLKLRSKRLFECFEVIKFTKYPFDTRASWIAPLVSFSHW